MSGTTSTITLPGRRVESAVATTDSGGNATFTWNPPFPAPPVLSVALAAGAGFRSARIAANTAAGATVNVVGAVAIVVLGISVLGAGVPSAGVQVHVTATEP